LFFLIKETFSSEAQFNFFYWQSPTSHCT
jgi:hypothetical protein